MKRVLTLFLTLMVLLVAMPSVEAQDVNDRLRTLFTPLQKAQDQAPFLFDMAAHEAEDKWFVPINHTDTNDLHNWWTVYYEMQHAAYNPNFIPETFSLIEDGKKWTRKDTIPIGLIDFEFNRFKSNAFIDSGVYFGWTDSVVWDIPGRLDHPYELNQGNPSRGTLLDVFLAAPLEATSETRDVVFRIDPDFMFYSSPYNSETQLPPNHIVEINFGDGVGFRNFNPSQIKHFDVVYPSDGEFVIEVRVRDDQEIRYSKSRFAVLHDEMKMKPDERITSIPGIDAGIYYPCDKNSDFEKLIIGVTGYDFAENKGVEDAYKQFMTHSRVMMLHNYGYAVAIVDFADSKDSIQNNADRLIQFIELMKCRQTNHIEHNFVVMGLSLGAVVSRYALAKMETPAYKAQVANDPNICHADQGHNTRLWLSCEGEYQGAHISLSAQAMINFFHDKLSKISKIGSFSVEKQAKDLDWAYANLLQRPATKQLLQTHIDSTDGNDNYFEHRFALQLKQEFDQLGYPQECKIVGLTNGNTDGSRQTAYVDTIGVPGNLYLDLNVETRTRIFRIFTLRHNLEITLSSNDEMVPLQRLFDIHIAYPRVYDNFNVCMVAILGTVITCGLQSPLCPVFATAALGCLGQRHIYGSFDLANPVPYDVMPGGSIHYAQMAHANRSKSKLYSIQLSTGAASAITGLPTVTLSIPIARAGFTQTTVNGTSTVKGHFNSAISNTRVSGGFKTELASFNFVPWYSAFDYKRVDSLDLDLNGAGIDSNLARTPFDLLIGREKSSAYPKSNLIDQGPLAESNGEMAYSHFFFRRDTAKQDAVQSLTILTREIGDLRMHLDNQVINRRSFFEAEKYINAGRKANPHYTYPNSLNFGNYAAVWAEDDGFEVGQDGDVEMRAGTEIRLQPGFEVSNGGEYHGWISNIFVCSYTFNDLRGLYLPPTPPPTSIDEVVDPSNFRIFPNPTSGLLTVETNHEGRYQIVNLMGQEVLSGSLTSQTNTIDLSTLVEGVYLINVKSNGIVRTERIVKQ